MSILRQIGQYLFIIRKDPNEKSSWALSKMHAINRISIMLFVVALIIIVIKMINR